MTVQSIVPFISQVKICVHVYSRTAQLQNFASDHEPDQQHPQMLEMVACKWKMTQTSFYILVDTHKTVPLYYSDQQIMTLACNSAHCCM